MAIKERLRERFGPYTPNYEIRQLPEIIQFGGMQIHSEFPKNRLDNDDIAKKGIKTRSGEALTPERIYDITGIEVRATADQGETIQSLGERAAAPLLTNNRDAINAVVFMSSYPNTEGLIGKENHAQAIARRFELSHLADSVEGLTQDGNKLPEALDWHMACSSFADWFTHMEKYQKQYDTFDEVLLVASEIHTTKLARIEQGEIDPSLALTIFGDMAAAMRFRPGKDITVLASTSKEFDEETNETICMAIDETAVRQPARFKRIPLRPRKDKSEIIDWNLRDSDRFFMDGPAVYGYIKNYMPGAIIETLDKANVSPEEVKTIICHQASFPVVGVGIFDELPKELQDKMHIDVRKGNYSSVSIMHALAEQIVQGQIHLGDIAVFAGFGAGLYASTVAVRLGES